MIPTSIDGTDITGATIDGTDVQEITVDGQTVFTAGIPPEVIDNFEPVLYENKNATLSTYYTGDVSDFNRQTTTVQEGTTALSFSTSANGINSFIFSTNANLNYPSAGDNFEWFVKTTNTGKDVGELAFGVQDSNNFYRAEVRDRGGTIQIVKTENGNNTALSSAAVNLNTSFFRCELSWGNNGTITFSLNQNNSELASITANDSTYSSGGIGWGMVVPGDSVNFTEYIFDGLKFV